MGDSFSFMPAGAGVLKNFALLLRQIFIYFLHSCLLLKKKNIFLTHCKFQNNVKCGIDFLFCPHPMPRISPKPKYSFYVKKVMQITLTFLYSVISLMLKGLKNFNHVNDSSILLLFHLKTEKVTMGT